MKVTSSKLIDQKKPVLKQLLDRLLQTYSYASILMTDSKGKQYSISKQGISITENMFVELGYVVKVYDGESYGNMRSATLMRMRLTALQRKSKIM